MSWTCAGKRFGGEPEVEARGRDAPLDEHFRHARLRPSTPRPTVHPDEQRRRFHAFGQVQVERERLAVDRRVDKILELPRRLRVKRRQNQAQRNRDHYQTALRKSDRLRAM
jgi:hypothetical protein